MTLYYLHFNCNFYYLDHYLDYLEILLFAILIFRPEINFTALCIHRATLKQLFHAYLCRHCDKTNAHM